MTQGAKQRAVVLGGGGPVGVGWQLGLAAGLKASGVDLADADFVVGTSAGSVTGALLMSGDDPGQLVDEAVHMMTDGVGGTGVDKIDPAALFGLIEMITGGDPDSDEASRLARVGQIAIDAATVPEDALVGAIGTQLAGRAWPKGFACTAVDVEDGTFAVWDEAAGVPIERAVASSCSVPGIYPPVSINGRRYMDGGARSPLNADLAAGHETVVVISCMLTTLPPGIEDPKLQAFFDRERAGVDALSAAGAAVELIEPDAEFLMLSGMGMALMDFSLVGGAIDAGLRLGKLEAERIRAIW